MCYIWFGPISLFQVESTAAKITDLVSEMLRFINTECQKCQFSSNHFGLLQLVCEEPGISSNFSSLQGRVVGSINISSNDIVNLLQQWVNTSPAVLIEGVTYTITAQCAVSIDNIGTSLCTMMSEVNTVESIPGGNSTLALAIAALVISIVDMTLLAFGFTSFVFIYVRGK